jgi:hypothetical protein
MTDKPDNELSELARRLAAQRQVVEGKCEICGTPFTGTRKRRYCSHNCAQKAYMRNKVSKKSEGQGDGK